MRAGIERWCRGGADWDCGGRSFLCRYWWLVFGHPFAVVAWAILAERLTRGAR